MGKWVIAGRLIGVGWFIGISIAGGIIGGVYLDRWLETSVIFTLVGLFVGLVVAFWGTYRMISPLMREQQGKDRESN